MVTTGGRASYGIDAPTVILGLLGATFDVVLSSIAIHNVPGATDRERAVREIARVLKPGGRVALQDIGHTAEYARVLTACGLRNVTRSGLRFAIVPPVRIVHAIR